MSFSLWTQAKRLVGDQLVCGEAIVKLNDVDVCGFVVAFLEHSLSCQFGHVVTDKVDAALAAERRRQISAHFHAENLDSLSLQFVLSDKAFAGDDATGRAVGGRAALELCEDAVDYRRVLDLVQSVLLLELRVRVVHGMFVVLVGDFCKMLGFRTVALHVFFAGVAEKLCCWRGWGEALELGHFQEMLV